MRSGVVLLKLGDRLRQERQRLGLNQADFGALAGVTKTSQFNYEKGDRSPDANYLAALRPHGVDIYFILTGEPLPVAAAALAPDEAELIARIRGMSDQDKESIHRMAFAIAPTASSLDSGKARDL